MADLPECKLVIRPEGRMIFTLFYRMDHYESIRLENKKELEKSQEEIYENEFG